jgi:hypothetical protein
LTASTWRTIRDPGSISEKRPPLQGTGPPLCIEPKGGELPRIHRVGQIERLVFQAWEWSERRYTVRHFILDHRAGAWEVAERRTTYRAVTRAELASTLGAAGFTDITWRMPEETRFYQPVVTARATSRKRTPPQQTGRQATTRAASVISASV